MHRFVFLLVSILGLSLPALGASSLTVRVLDPQDAAVPRARVELTRRDDGFRTERASDAQGSSRFSSLAPGAYVISVSAPGFARSVVNVRLGDGANDVDVRLEIAAVTESVVVSSAKTAQKRTEATKTVDVIDGDEMEQRDEYFIPEALRTVPGVRMEQLGGPGSFTSLKIRGLRTEDTAIVVDGARLRDPSAPQGDASSFIENLVATDIDRVEILRGSGSSLYGTNAGGGLIQIVTSPGGGEPRGNLLVEGGGLGLFRAGATTAGGYHDRFLYSFGASHVSVSKGVDGQDASRNTSYQGRALYQLTPRASVSVRVYGSGARLDLNESPITLGAPPAGEIRAVPLPDAELRRYESGTPVDELEVGSANYIPSANDPDNRREGSFTSTLVTYDHQPTAALSYSLRYHGLFTSRSFAEGPLGPSPFEPFASTTDRYDGDIQTFGARMSYEWGRRQVLHAGYELERESFRNRTVNDPTSPATVTDVSQSSHTFYAQDQVLLLDGSLAIAASARAQFFSLDEPRFEPAEGAPYQAIAFDAPEDAFTGDVSAGYAFTGSGTRLRAHLGSGYRAPSLFERFGAFYSTFGYSPYGDPRLAPERMVTFDVGVEQSLVRDRLLVTATYFRTRLSQIIVFDFSGAIDPGTDPFGRFGGYLSTDGGVTQGLELTSRIAPLPGLDVKASYTFNDAEPPRGVSPDQTQAFAIPRHQFSVVAAKSFGRGFTLGFDLLASSSYTAPVFDLQAFVSRVYRFDSYVKTDLVGSYRLHAGSLGLRFFGKVENLFDEKIYASGFRTPGRHGLAGVSFEF